MINITGKINQTNTLIQEITEWARQFNGKTAVIPKGKYKGRYGVVCGCHFYENRIIGCVHPYDLVKKDGSYLYDHPDARTYWSFDDFKDSIQEAPPENTGIVVLEEWP